MSKPRTNVVILLDRSGSMGSIKSQAVTNYNEQVQQMKENSVDQDIFCSLLTFNGNVFEHLWNVPAEQLEEATEESYVPKGGTAYRDAIGHAINKLKEEQYQQGDVTNLIIIISDGQDYDSKKYSKDDLRKLITEQQQLGNWTFTFMGCSIEDLQRTAQETAIPISNMAAFAPASAGLAFNASQRCTGQYYKKRAIRSSVGGSSVNLNDCFYSQSNSVADFTQDTTSCGGNLPEFNTPIVDESIVYSQVQFNTPIAEVPVVKGMVFQDQPSQTQSTRKSDVFSRGSQVQLK